jgi:SH3-like domain-containing protein
MNNQYSYIKIYITTIIIAMLCLATSVAEAKMVSITGEKVNLRSGPGTKYAIQWEYGKGFPLRILSSKGNWYKVQDFENDSGWVYKKMVNRTPHLIVKRKRINIRSQPSSRSKLIGKADYGVVFKTLEQKNGWAKVKHDKGLAGWVRRDLLWGF